jgi:hypothetical protein
VSLVFVERRIELTFDDSWRYVVKWDEERAYQDGICTLPTSRAVDFCGIRDSAHRGPLVHLIELKDFRAHRIENKKRLRETAASTCSVCGEIQPNLYQEVGLKVRDTLAGLVSAAHQRRTEPERWHPLAEALTRWDRPVQVILWLEEDPRETSAARASVRIDNLKRQLRWLTSHVMVASSVRLPPGITVRKLSA